MKGDRNQFSSAKPGQTTKLIQHLRKVACLGPRLNLNEDTQGVRERIAMYFELCEEDDIKPTVEGLAASLGLTRMGLYYWRIGQNGKNEETRKVLNDAVSVLSALMASYMSEGMINPVSGIFLMRNNYGYRNEDVPDKSEEEPQKLEGANIKALEEKYKDSIPDDVPRE